MVIKLLKDDVINKIAAGEVIERPASIVKELIDYPVPQGTRIIVEELFFNTPARKGFLKTAVTESNNILDLVNKYALAYPEVAFTFIRDNKQYYKTPGNGNWLDTIKVVLGAELANSLVSIDYQGEKYIIQGYISNPDYTKRSRKNQYFFINSRPIRSPLLYRVIDNSYKGLLISREQPVIILSIKLNPEDVDVNIHPQKSEVRFKDEQGVFQVVYQILRDKLTKLDYNPIHKWQQPLDITHMASAIKEEQNKNIQAYKNKGMVSEDTMIFEHSTFDTFTQSPHRQDLYISKQEFLPDLRKKQLEFRVIGQYNLTYILIEYEDALWLIDQHAAEEKIIYSKLKNQYHNSEQPTQVLAFPLTIDLAINDIELIMANIEFFDHLGFNLGLLGHETIVIRNAPVMSLGEERTILLDIMELLKEGVTIDIYDEALMTMACKKSVKAGMSLNFHEMETLVAELFATKDYKNCPHGRPTLIKLNNYDIERMFKR